MPSLLARSTAVFCLSLMPLGERVSVAGFVETFNGTGPFSSTGDVLQGFDNPGWKYSGDGMFQDGGLRFENSPPPSDQRDSLERLVTAAGDFSHVVEIREHLLISDPFGVGNAFIALHNWVSEVDEFTMTVRAIQDDPSKYWVFVTALPQFERHVVDKGPHIQLEMYYEESQSQISFAYDNNLDDENPSVTLATFDYQGLIKEEALVELNVGHFEAQEANALIDRWTFTSSEPPIFPGDFNANGIFDAEDIDLLNAEIRSGTNNPDFDLVEDGVVDAFDRTFWVHTITNTFFGDANLDGEFNSGDLVAVFQAGHHEDGSMAGWATGDWNGDARFTSRDLVVAFQDGGYEAGPRAAAAVPEPSAAMMLLIGLLAVAKRCVLPCGTRFERTV